MPQPTYITTLLGLTSYYGTFLPTLHNIWTLLNELLGENTKWNWTPNHSPSIQLQLAIFGYMITVIGPHLKWFDVNLLSSTISRSMIPVLSQLLLTRGVPKTLVTDPSTLIDSLHFAKFCPDRWIFHIITAPLAMFGSSTAVAEFRGQGLKMACEAINLTCPD
ncbi:hypothetical protein ACTXT7_003007 [Hymenolepis weldensis]